MPNAELKQTIKHQIADILKSNPPGYGRTAIIARVTTTDEHILINQCLEEMRGIGDIQFRHNRFEITPVGRSSYSELNNPEPEKSELPIDENDAADDDTTETYRPVNCIMTPDGELHMDMESAQAHWSDHLRNETIKKFIEQRRLPADPEETIARILFHFMVWQENNQ